MSRAGAFWAIVALALAARASVFALNAAQTEPVYLLPDSASYIHTAQDLRGDERAFEGREHRRGERTPVYPALIAALFELGVAAPADPRGILGVQLLLGALAAGLVFWLASALAGARAGAVAGVLAALEPSGIALCNVVLSETLYALGLLCVVGLLWRLLSRPGVGSLLALAAVAGVAPLIRPVALYANLVLAGLLSIWVPRTALRRGAAALFLVVALLPPALWSLRNLNAVGAFALSSSGAWGQALFAHEVAQAAGEPEPQDAGGARAELWELDYGRDRGLSFSEIQDRRSRYFAETLRAHPGTALALWARSLVRMAGVPDSLLSRQLLESPPGFEGGSVRARLAWLLELGALAPWLMLGMATSLAGLAAIPWLAVRARRWTPERRALGVGIALLALYHLAVGALVSGLGARYRAPALPLLAILAGAGAAELARLLRERVRRST